ncbi:MAG: T9SS type A sorting domain-containing protein [Bacteroidota bacterium]
MKRKILLLVIMLSMSGWKAYCQDDREGPTEGYIKNAVPPFDTRTRQLDMNKYEKKPVRLYKASPQNPLQQQRNDHNAVTVADNTDVQVFPSADAQSEQHMTVSKVNPDNIILSSNTPYYQGYYVSQNGGTSWFGSDHMPDGVQSYGDPTTAFDSNGEVFFETMTWGGAGFKTYSSTNQGTAWDAPVSYSYTPISFDKEMMVIDNLPGSPHLGNIYTAWTDFGSPYRVLFTRSFGGDYCSTIHTSGCSGDQITHVVLNTINNFTTGCGGSSHYTYYNPSIVSTTTSLSPAGGPYSLTVSFGTDANQYFGAWIDYNLDGIFTAAEFLGASGNAGSSGTISISFTVAGSALNGTTRLRIVGGNNATVTNAQSCGASSSPWGETQDYNVTITGATTPNINLHNSWGQGTNVQTGPNGEVYVCWANYGTGSVPADGMGFSVSANGGSSFLDLTPAFPYAGMRILGGDPLFNNSRVADFPTMAVDKSCSSTRGRIYIAYPAKQGGTGKAAIFIRSSSNQGASWSAATEISISAGRQNWFPSVTVDDATGTVSVAYLTLDLPSGFTTNTYVAYSFNGGTSWDNIKVSDVGHTVAAIPGFASGYCGDYIGNTAWGNKNYVSWNDDRTGQWQNYVSRVDFSRTALYSSNTDFNIKGPITHSLPAATDVQYKAVANISSPVGSTFTVQSGASVDMFAGGHIILSPGFIANSGCHFNGHIGTVSSCVNAVQRDEATEEINEKLKDLKPAYNGDAGTQFSMYPNPAGNEINFEYLLPNPSEVTLTLMDLNGKEVKILINRLSQESGLNHFNADISYLKDGIYTYRLVTADYVKTGKFVKAE